MLCQACHSKEATVHIASVIYAAADVDARHFCEPCAQVAQTANPVLSVTARNLPPVHVKPVTSVALPAKVRIQSVEQSLAELDPIWYAFCARRGYNFLAGRELWPNRMAFVHGKIDHRLVLTMDVHFTEILKRGFDPEIPWSLYAIASLPFWTEPPAKKAQAQVLTFELFRQRPFSELRDLLDKELERAFAMLSGVTREDILQKGQVPQGKLGPFRLYPW